MVLRAKYLPWRPSVTITGRAFYSVDTAAGEVMSHREDWDALSDNSYFSASLCLLVQAHIRTSAHLL